MSDPKSSYGEPVDEPSTTDDVVGRAKAGLADAEAAGRHAVGESDTTAEPTTVEPTADGAAAPVEPVTPAAEPADAALVDPSVAPAVRDDRNWDDEYSSLGGDPVDAAPAGAAAATGASTETSVADAYQPATEVAPTAVTASEPASDVAPAAVATATYAPQPIFVQAPEAPTPRGNRAAAGAIGLLAAISFGLLYFAAWLGFGALAGDVTADNVADTALAALGTASLWVPIVVFYLAFWLLGAIINRGRWGAWVIFGLFVGIASYAGHVLGALFQAPFWTLTAAEGAELVAGELLAPLAIAAFVIGRELTIWFGTWVAARGKRVTELNIEAQREYERTLEAGPQLVQQ